MNPLTVYAGGATTEVIVNSPTQPISPVLVNLAPNTAIDLGPMFPTMTVPNGENQTDTAKIYGNAGCAYDAKRTQVVVFGGGHAGTNYDSVLRQQMSDLALVEDYPPTPAQPYMIAANYDTPPTLVNGAWIPNAGKGAWLDGHAAARHTVSQLAVWGDELIVFGLIEGNGPRTQLAMNEGNPTDEFCFRCKGQIAHYNLVSKTWDFESANPTQTDGDGAGALWGALDWDSASGLFVWISSGGLYSYDPVVRKKVKQTAWNSTNLVDETGAAVPVSWVDINGTLCYRPVDDKHYWFSRGIKQGGVVQPWSWQPWRLDLNRANWAASKLVKLAYTGQRPDQSTPSTYTWSGEQPVRYDTKNDVFGTGPWSGVFYVWDPNSKAWSHQTINAPVAGLNVATLSHMLAYSPEANVYWFMTDAESGTAPAAKSHTWAYRYR